MNYCEESNTTSGRRFPSDPDWDYRRGDLYLMDFDPRIDSEQSGVWPAVVLQNNTGNFFSSTLIVAPITSQSNKRRDLPVHCYVEKARGLHGAAIVLLEKITAVDKCRIHKYLGRMDHFQMDEIKEKLETSLDLYVPEGMNMP